MRLLMVVLTCSVALSAQVTTPDASARLKQLERNLANAMKARPGPVSYLREAPIAAAPNRPCAIPLLKVGPDSSFQANMPAIAPDRKVRFAVREVTPPAPACDEQEKK
jgi:hypothetical protein